jgi:hypothetical protein
MGEVTKPLNLGVAAKILLELVNERITQVQS